MEKAERYRRLVAERRSCDDCAPALTNPARVDGAVHDSERIGGYMRWQGNLDAPLVVVAQDFADVRSFRACGGWPDPRLRTNRRLVRFLRVAGFDVALPRQGAPEDTVFFTNAVLCLKQGGISAPVPRRCFERCATRFLRRTLDLVRPRAVAALGSSAVNATLHAYGLPPEPRLRPLLGEGRTFDLVPGMRLFPMPHPSREATALHEMLWAALGSWLRDEPAPAGTTTSRVSRAPRGSSRRLHRQPI